MNEQNNCKDACAYIDVCACGMCVCVQDKKDKYFYKF